MDHADAMGECILRRMDGDGLAVGKNLTLIGNGIELDLLATVHKLADYHRMLLRNRRGQ